MPGPGNGPITGYGDYHRSQQYAEAQLFVGKQMGRDQGYAEGNEDGYHNGRRDGWDAAVETANAKIEEAAGYIRAHVADKAALQQALDAQNVVITQLKARLQQLEAENQALRTKSGQQNQAAPHPLSALVEELRTSNGELQTQVHELEAKYDAKNKEWVDGLWSYNRAVVFVNAMRNTVSQLSADPDSELSHEIAQVFSAEYDKEIERGMSEGAIGERLETDDAFATAMPLTHQFLRNILQSANPELARAGQPEDVDDWVPNGV